MKMSQGALGGGSAADRAIFVIGRGHHFGRSTAALCITLIIPPRTMKSQGSGVEVRTCRIHTCLNFKRHSQGLWALCDFFCIARNRLPVT